MTDQAALTLTDVAPRRTWWRRVAAPRLGLRARITLAFALSAALLSTLLAGSTWALTRENIVNQRESSATRQAERNATYIGGQLEGGQLDDQQLRDALTSLQSDSPSRSLVRDGQGTWTNQTTALDEDAVPPAMLRLVEDGQASRMRLSLDDVPQLLIGLPLADGALYFEFVSLADTQSALESLSASLFGATLVTTLAGAALG